MVYLGLEHVKCAVQVCTLVNVLATLSEYVSVATNAEHFDLQAMRLDCICQY